MFSDSEVERAAENYTLGLPKAPAAGASGELFGRGAGSSLEFQEFREYVPGDDIRHVDWSAYARSDTLMVRLYREEISPRTEILLDTSRSMTTGGGAKERVARQLAALVAILSGRVGGRPIIVPLAEQAPGSISLDELDRLPALPFVGRLSLGELLADGRISLKRRSIRIVISDFLFPHDPELLIRRLAAEASALWIVQMLSAWEADPTVGGGSRLVDIETEAETDAVLDRGTVARYLSRLKVLQDELLRNCRRAHADMVVLVADRGLPELCRDELCECGFLRVE